MLVSADIVFDRRSLMQWLFDPIYAVSGALMSIPAQLNFGRRRRLPVMLAAEAAECGLACMAMISRYHGHDVDLNGLRQRFSLSLAGASLRSLMGIADQLGFSTRALRVELSALAQGAAAGDPALGPQPFRGAQVGRPQARRPSTIRRSARARLPLDEFSKHFTGVVLELAPAPRLRAVTARAPMKLSMPLVAA